VEPVERPATVLLRGEQPPLHFGVPTSPEPQLEFSTDR
jgi:hypothetical protein